MNQAEFQKDLDELLKKHKVKFVLSLNYAKNGIFPVISVEPEIIPAPIPTATVPKV